MFHQPSRHLQLETTPSVLTIRAPLQPELPSPYSVPQAYTCIAYTTPVSRPVHLQCTSDMPAYRYLIVQFPTTDHANFCELEVYVRRKLFQKHGIMFCNHEADKPGECRWWWSLLFILKTAVLNALVTMTISDVENSKN